MAGAQSAHGQAPPLLSPGRTFGAPLTADMLTELDEKGWELYNLGEDFAETNNLAAKDKGRLIAMIGMWYVEAGKYNVLPIDSRGLQRVREERPQVAENRNRYVLYPGRNRFRQAQRHKFSTDHFRSTLKSRFLQNGQKESC